ncbi:hypothetical protein [Leptospira wolffii]|uniref:hypothetical protein n=1 Tax=Leptospira wolffii TaxID=409998 RepID=UPI00031B7822|nr:hypothetical protein [Leptospira wolffii]EPG65213.1 hypothetical protein LEP1GSC061_3008 [Leptospira wolffii serovar Khorat str. Khorat-H2]
MNPCLKTLILLQIILALRCSFGAKTESQSRIIDPYPSLKDAVPEASRHNEVNKAIEAYEKFINQDKKEPNKAIELIDQVIQKANKNKETNIVSKAEGIKNEIRADLTKTRNEELNMVKAEFEKALSGWKESLAKVEKNADNQSDKKIKLTLVGILITVSIAALTAASPANITIISGLGAAGGGIVTFQNTLVEEGQTRVANVRVYETIKTKGESAVTEYYQAYTEMKIDPLGVDFVKHSTTAWKSVGELQMATIHDIPLSTEEEIESSRKRAEAEKSGMDENLKGVIEKLKTEKSNRKSNVAKYTELRKAIDEALKEK